MPNTNYPFVSLTNPALEAAVNEAESLDELLSAITAHANAKDDLSFLPTYGGVAPESTMYVWSWDTSRVLIGESIDDFEILARDEWQSY